MRIEQLRRDRKWSARRISTDLASEVITISTRTAIGFTHRARAFFAAHGIAHVLRGARHQRITPYTPRHNGTVERYNRILSEEFLYARTWISEGQRSAALNLWNVHDNYHRPHTAAGNRPPASRLHATVTNVMASYN